eukprot:g9272.t1
MGQAELGLCLGLLLCTGRSFGMHVQIMVTSKLSSFERRQTLRDVFISCAARVATLEHDVEQLFFLGDAADVDEELRLGLKEEGARFNDLVFVGGPDADPAVERDVTYVLERPTARGFRLAIGTAWLAEHRPDLDYVMYLDDDSYLHLPRLLTALQAHGSPSLAMGYVMETQLDTLDSRIGRTGVGQGLPRGTLIFSALNLEMLTPKLPVLFAFAGEALGLPGA